MGGSLTDSDTRETEVRASPKASLSPGPKLSGVDVDVADDTPPGNGGVAAVGASLTFDGYRLTIHGQNGRSFTAFSGPANECAKESEKDVGPTPQGLYIVDSADIEDLEPSDSWGEHRVRIKPCASTVKRMMDCFKALRTQMYIHGGNVKGSHGCIELNDDADEQAFFLWLVGQARRVQLEVRYTGERKSRYEDPHCPY